MTQPLVVRGAPDSSGPAVYDVDENRGEMQGGPGRGLRLAVAAND